MNISDAPVSLSDHFIQKFSTIRNQTVKICAPLKAEDFVVQPIDEVSPPKWHLGHTTWFFESFILKAYKKNYQVYHQDFNYVFNSYYESMGTRVVRTNRGNLSRPSVEEVMQYRAYVDNAMKEFLSENNSLSEKVQEIFILGLNHEQQHQELLLYDIKYIFGNNPLFPAYSTDKHLLEESNHASSTDENYLTIEEGLYCIGYSGNKFCYDNELGEHQVFLPAFQVRDQLTTNLEYMEFIQDGGYKKFQYWLSDGWEWVKENKINAPLYWHNIEGEWFYYTMYGLQKINRSAPVTHISFYEADAFACWKNQRLLTEFEWEVACKTLSPQIPEEANLQDKAIFEPVITNEHNLQFYGDVWEWTSSSYRPYPYFKAEEGALGEYNGKFMNNQMVLRGGSCATPRDHVRSTYRNFFHPHQRWIFSGIRLAQYL